MDGDDLCSGQSGSRSPISSSRPAHSAGGEPQVRDVTVRVQRVKTDRLKYKLIFFSTLALLLIIGAFFSEYLCPYDLMNRIWPLLRQLPRRNICWVQTASAVICCLGSLPAAIRVFFSTLLLVGFITVFGSLIGIICAWSGKWIDTIMMRLADMFLAFPGLVFALAVAPCWEAASIMLSWP